MSLGPRHGLRWAGSALRNSQAALRGGDAFAFGFIASLRDLIVAYVVERKLGVGRNPDIGDGL
jgi:hypothetical protein